MLRLCSALLVSAILSAGLVRSAQADDKDVKATLDKAIKALGGEEKLKKAEAYTEKTKGTITFGGNTNEFASERTYQGLDRYHTEFGGDQFRGVVVLDGDKGWRRFGDNKTPMDAAALANEKRSIYLSVVPTTIVPLKGNGFKVESAPEEKIGDKPAAVLKVTGPDGKDFTLAFDKESGLPVRVIATVMGFQGQEFTQETTFADYKDFGGIKRPTKVELKRDGETFLVSELKDFKVLEKVDPKTFAEPE
jgi:hypothetical protein